MKKKVTIVDVVIIYIFKVETFVMFYILRLCVGFEQGFKSEISELKCKIKPFFCYDDRKRDLRGDLDNYNKEKFSGGKWAKG